MMLSTKLTIRHVTRTITKYICKYFNFKTLLIFLFRSLVHVLALLK